MSSNNRRIQRVPALLIAEEEDEMKNDYYPKVASIGPYHYGKPELAQVEAFKPFAVVLLVRSRKEKDFFYQKVLDMIGQVRNCYEKESVDKYSDADLAQMMLRDASLIIAEMEIHLEHGQTYHKRKAMIDHFGRLTGAVLFRDFILVENQIPLCVIQLLIELRYGAGKGPEMINNYVNKCLFGEIRPIGKYLRVPLHLLEFMHIILVCDCVQPQEPPTETSNRSIEEGWRGKKGGAPNHTSTLGDPPFREVQARVEAPNHTLLGAPDHTLTLGDPPFRVVEEREEDWRGKDRRKRASKHRVVEEREEDWRGKDKLARASKHTLTLRDQPSRVVEARVLQGVQTKASNWSIEESCSGELGAPGSPNLTSTLGPHKPPTETSSNRSILVEEDILLMAPYHTLVQESPQYATETSNKAKKETHSFRKVMELKARGIHFRPSATQSLLDVKFESGFFYATLQLPEMFVSHYSKPFFKNLVAYELLPGVETEPTVTSYINLMQSLVERPEDLEELRERKIVYNQLGSDEEALNVFKDINTHGASDDELYFKVREEIQVHYNNRIKTWIAELIHTHFRSPWTVAAFLAAAAIIALTAAQLYYGVHPVADKTPTSS